jgi:OFA family oxalate/formate antiporter-like MFS transporter
MKSQQKAGTMKKYLVLIASILIQTCLGGIYAWSVFAPSLHGDFGLSMGATQLIFGICIASFTIAMIFAGRWQEKRGPRLVAAIGGVLFAAGYVIASASGGNLFLLILGIGVVAGAGIGFGYVCPIATCIKWFPKQKGFVTGLAVAGFGGGAVLLSSLASALFGAGQGVLEIFRFVGLVYGAAIVLSALLLFVPEGAAEAAKKQAGLAAGALFRDGRYWLLLGGMFAGTFAGLLTIGNLKPIGLAGGVAAGLATTAISSLAIGNACGRILWGVISDKIQGKAIPLSLAFLTLAVVALVPLSHSGWAFVATAFAIGFGFGSCFVLYAAAVAHVFGPGEVGRSYPLVFLAYGISGTLGPAFGGRLFDVTGGYTAALVVAAALAAAGALAYVLFGRKLNPA